MALLCYNKGCGQTFDASNNGDDSCLFHPGVPIFHDALKGWSCCRKRTTDFSEFLSIKGCTHGRHSNEKPQEPLWPEVSSEKAETRRADGGEIIYRGPKSAEALQRDRPSPDEAKTKLPLKVSTSLAQVLEKLDLSKKAEREKQDSRTVLPGTRCKNAGCKTVYQGPETDAENCSHHPGGPVFHEGYKFWSCCCIRTTDFNSFLEQRGCSSGRHCWSAKKDKKKVACRYDWHQTATSVVVTVYSRNAVPELSCVEANGTVLSCQIHFEDNKVFQRSFHLWGVIDVPQSSVNMVPSKMEIVLRKAHQVSWGKLEDPTRRAEPEPEDPQEETTESYWDIADDDISDSDEEWAYDTPQNRRQRSSGMPKGEDTQNRQMKDVEDEMKKAAEERRRLEEEKEAQRRQEEAEGYEDMPDLEAEGQAGGVNASWSRHVFSAQDAPEESGPASGPPRTWTASSKPAKAHLFPPQDTREPKVSHLNSLISKVLLTSSWLHTAHGYAQTPRHVQGRATSSRVSVRGRKAASG